MPACPRDSNYSTLPPPGFTDTNVALKRGQLIDLLGKIIEKCQQEPLFLVQEPKQIDLLVGIAQLTLLSTPISSEDKRDFLTNIVASAQELLSTENETHSTMNENTIPTETETNDAEGDFSLDDLANEYLQNEPTPSSLNDKPTTPSETTTTLPSKPTDNDAEGDFSLDDLANEYLQNEPTPNENEEPALTVDNLNKCELSSSPSGPVTNVLSALIFPPPAATEPISIKPALESILFSNRLSSSDAADDADDIWKEQSSLLGQMFCTKTEEIPVVATKRISSCLLDRSLYERLTRLIALLPKQCIRNSVQQPTIRPNDQSHRPQRGNNDTRRPGNRPSFHQNSSQANPRYASAQNPRQYSNQQGNANGYFVDRRQQQQQQYQQNRYPPAYPGDQQYQQNRHPAPGYAPYPTDQQYQPRGPPKNNQHNNGNPNSKKKPPNNNQQAPNQQQRGPRKGFGGGGGGNKPTNEKSGANPNPQ